MATRVAVTLRISAAGEHGELRDCVSHDWLERLDRWGMTPFLVPNTLADPSGFLDGIAPDLLLLTGGDDLGATPRRDATELALLDRAVARRLPTLGVCRGMQLINVRFGGSLVPVPGHVARCHGVRLAPAFRDIYGERADVNSFHAFGIPAAGIGRGLTAMAWDDGDRAESLVHRDLPIAAVMWHPERAAAPAADARLVARLVAEGAFWR